MNDEKKPADEPALVGAAAAEGSVPASTCVWGVLSHGFIYKI
jgi:hypothetical protein